MAKIGCDVICKSHSARSERDPYRLCPTKLSKQELENLYFALLENNLELKKTINGQQDRIKVLSTKVQRMTSAQNVFGREGKRDCCLNTKAIVKQQKEMITDLKRSNERMADRIRKLNMRLCSAKQFCKSATPRVLRCSTATSPYLIKNSSHSFKQHSQSTLKLALSCQNLTREAMVTTYVQTDSWKPLESNENKNPCEDNKCITALDELKQKIEDLNEEISRTHSSCTSQVLKLERALQLAREESVRARSQRVSAEHHLQRAENKLAQVTASARAADQLTAELKTELTIEKRKVAELETRLKAATISNRVTKSIEDTLNSIQESNRSPTVNVTGTCTCSANQKAELNVQQPNPVLLSPKQDNNLDDTKLSKSTDDSGFLDRSHAYLDDQSLNKIIEDLSKRVVVLQAQVDYLTISPPENETVEEGTQVSATTEDRDAQTDIELQPNLESPKKAHLSRRENLPNHSEEILEIDKNPTNDDRTIDNEISINIPISESTPGWKASVTKINLITKITQENNKSKRDENKELLSDNIEINEERKESSSELKTYTVNVNKTEKDKNKNAFEKDKNVTGKNKNAAGKNKHVIGKDRNDGEKIKTRNNHVVKDDIVKDNKTKGKSDDVEIDRGRKSKEKTFFGNKMLHVLKMAELKTKVARKKTLTRSKTEVADSSTCEEVTYTVDGDGSSRPDSPDNTDFDISSMTDVSDERELKTPPKNLLSPGEHTSTHIRSDYCRSPTTNFSLSEGEIPNTSARRKSNEGKPSYSRRSSTPKMEDTIQAVTEELARCKRLLFSSRSQDATMTVPPR